MNELYERIAGCNPNRRTLILTVLDGETAGEKALYADGCLQWTSRKDGLFANSGDVLPEISSPGIHTIEGRQVYCEFPGREQKQVICADGTAYTCKAVIVATGTAERMLNIPGEEENVGRGVSYCATCDAPLYRGRSVAVIGYSPEAEEEVNFLSEVASEVLYFPVYRDEPKVSESVKVVRQIPQAILNKEAAEEAFSLAQADPAKSSAKDLASGEALSAAGEALSVDALKQGQLAVQTTKGIFPADGIFVLRSSVPAGQLIPGIEMDGEHVKVNLQMETSVPGCFACGDITGRPYQYVKAAGQGNVAVLSAVSYLDQK